MCVFVFTKVTGQAQRVPGQLKDDSCMCKINSSIWTFPAARFLEVTTQVQTCENNLDEFHNKVNLFIYLTIYP